jgi:hypothetical protein
MCLQILKVAAVSVIATITTTTHSPIHNETIAVYFINFSFVETKI